MRVTIEQAADLLLSGQNVAVPTETVYGLAASLENHEAIERIFQLKRRPSSNPLIVHVHSTHSVKSFVKQLPGSFDDLAKAFWPGPMTLVLEALIEKVPSTVRAGLPTAAFRVPKHPITQQLLALTGPLVMPSANLSGTPSSTTPEHVEADFGKKLPVLVGPCPSFGLESTVLVYFDNAWQVIRQGALPSEAFEEVLGYRPQIQQAKFSEVPLCPGQLFRHYAPKTKLLLTKDFSKVSNSIILGFSDRVYPANNQLISLGNANDPDQIAENLYSTLRRLDSLDISIAFVDINLPEIGIYLTILERLSRAAES